jgi:hypothetical protein
MAKNSAASADAKAAKELEQAMADKFGPGKLIVRKSRVLHWPKSSEIRALPGDLVWKNDPWIQGQEGKLMPYDGKAVPKIDASKLSRSRQRELIAQLSGEKVVDPPTSKAPAPSAQKQEVRDTLIEKTDDELSDLDG